MDLDRLAIRAIPGKGRGVLARQAFPADALLVLCPTMELSAEDCRRLEATALGTHYFAHPERPGEGLAVLGVITLLNHAARPSARLAWRHDPEAGWLAGLHAKAPLDEGAELTIDYDCPLWFEPLP